MLRSRSWLSFIFVLLPAFFNASSFAETNSFSHLLQPSTEEYTNGLSLKQTLQKVLDYNESVQIKLLEAEINRLLHKAEKGIFEPAFVGSYEYDLSNRENTAEQAAQLFSQQVFHETNNTYNTGVEFLSPVGTRFRVGYNLRDLNNNLTQGTNQYVSTVGLTLQQPLLKGFGITPTMVRIRLAAVSSAMAFQEYRKQLMLTVSRTESYYWDLYLTQEQERISRESVGIADSIYNDNKSRVDVGKSSELEVLQAQAGLSLRRARASDASQKLSEAGAQLTTLFSGHSIDTNLVMRAADHPTQQAASLDYYEGFSNAFDLNPDYLSKKKQAVAENIRLAYAKNQRWPQLDLKGSYGLNGLDKNVEGGLADVRDRNFQSWSVGMELRIPLAGGIKERNEYAAAKLNARKALVAIKELEVAIANALDTSLLKVRNLTENVKNYQAVVDFHQQLLESQLARLEVGKIDSKTVLDTEEKYFEARASRLENLVNLQKAMLELELVQGVTLKNRNLELTPQELHQRTEQMVASGKFEGPLYTVLEREVGQEYNKIMHQKYSSNGYPASNGAAISSETDTKEQAEARRMLRQRVQELHTEQN